MINVDPENIKAYSNRILPVFARLKTCCKGEEELPDELLLELFVVLLVVLLLVTLLLVVVM